MLMQLTERAFVRRRDGSNKTSPQFGRSSPNTKREKKITQINLCMAIVGLQLFSLGVWLKQKAAAPYDYKFTTLTKRYS